MKISESKQSVNVMPLTNPPYPIGKMEHKENSRFSSKQDRAVENNYPPNDADLDEEFDAIRSIN